LKKKNKLHIEKYSSSNRKKHINDRNALNDETIECSSLSGINKKSLAIT